MSLEYKSILASVKVALKAKGITYAQVAMHLGVSEQTIKRLFIGQDGSIGRLVDVCNFIGISFFEITRMAAEDREHTFGLSIGQEEYFCENPVDYAVFDELLKGHGVCN